MCGESVLHRRKKRKRQIYVLKLSFLVKGWQLGGEKWFRRTFGDIKLRKKVAERSEEKLKKKLNFGKGFASV